MSEYITYYRIGLCNGPISFHFIELNKNHNGITTSCVQDTTAH